MPGLVDLTLTLRPGMRGYDREPKFSLARDGWNASTLHLYSHCGTHMDAQVHFEAGPGTIDRVPLQRCMGPAWVVNLSMVPPKTLIEISHLGSIAQRLVPGESLLLRTDWSRHAQDPSVYRDALPRVSHTLATWCAQKQLKMLGVEPPSVADVNNKAEVASIHQTLLGANVLIVEGLVNLDQLRAERVFFAALPLKPLDGDGSPCRAFAVDGENAADQLARLLP